MSLNGGRGRTTAANGAPRVGFGRFRVTLPASRILRVLMGGLLILGGVFAFLPVLGIWMLPLGVIVLSVDLPVVRRLRRRIEAWWGRRKRTRKRRSGRH